MSERDDILADLAERLTQCRREIEGLRSDLLDRDTKIDRLQEVVTANREARLIDLWAFLEECLPKTNDSGWLIRDEQRRVIKDFLQDFEAAEAAEAAKGKT